MAAKVSSEGQITLSKEIRDLLGLKPGSPVGFPIDAAGVRLESVPAKQARALAGSLKKYSKRRVSEKHVRDKVQEEIAREAAQEGVPSRH